MKKTLKKLFSFMLTAAFAASLYACSSLAPDDNNSGTDYSQAVAASYVSVSINPAIELLTDADNIVIGVNFANEDAEVLLAETNLIGMTAEVATALIVQLAAEAGYIDVEGTDNEVVITVVNDNETTASDIADSLTGSAQDVLDENGITGNAIKNTLGDIVDEAAGLGISVYKYKLILAAIAADPENTVDSLINLTETELRAMLKTYFEELKDVAADYKTAYKEIKAEIRAKYANMFALGEEIETLEESIETLEDELEALQAQFDAADEAGKPALQEQMNAKQAEINAANTSLETKKAEFNALHEAFKAEIEEAHEFYKEQSKAIKEDIKAILMARRNKWKNKFEEHKNEFHQKEDKLRQDAEGLGISKINLKIINMLVELYPEEYASADALKDKTTAELMQIVQAKYAALMTEFQTALSDFETAKAAIDAEYSAMFGLEEQIENLKDEIQNLKRQYNKSLYLFNWSIENGTDTQVTQEQLDSILANIGTKEAALEALNEDYEEQEALYEAEIETAYAGVEAVKENLKELFAIYKNAFENNQQNQGNIRDNMDEIWEAFQNRRNK